MLSNTFITQVHNGMRIISADGVYVGKVWQVHFRDTEASIEVRPYTFWEAFLEVFVLRQMHPTSGHLFLPADSITQIVGKRVQVKLDARAARACVSRPPWIKREKIPPTGFNSPRLE
jgi:hypothetical protein